MIAAGAVDYGECEYGGWYGLLVRVWVMVWVRVRVRAWVRVWVRVRT